MSRRNQVSHVVIDGTVDGPVHTTEYLELLPNAKITGDVSYRTLEMQVGAVIEGRLLHIQTGSADVVELKRLSGAGTSASASGKSAGTRRLVQAKPEAK